MVMKMDFWPNIIDTSFDDRKEYIKADWAKSPARVLLKRIKNANANYVKMVIEPELVIRQSVRKIS